MNLDEIDIVPLVESAMGYNDSIRFCAALCESYKEAEIDKHYQDVMELINEYRP